MELLMLISISLVACCVFVEEFITANEKSLRGWSFKVNN